MTYGDRIRSMNDKELAEFLSLCIIPAELYEPMYITNIGRFHFEEDLMEKLGEEIEEE